MQLTADNYHSPAANVAYMSVSEFKRFLSCSAAAMAELRGEYQPAAKDAYAFGSYVDRALLTPDALTQDMAENPDAYEYRGKLRAWVHDANAVVERCKRDPYFMRHLVGNAQYIYTFDLYGVTWKAMLDVYNPDTRTLVDLKTCANIDKLEWSDAHECRVPFYESYGYWLQLAVYREAVMACYGHYPEHVKLAVVSKQTPPDIRVISFNNTRRFAKELDRVKEHLPRIMAIKSGIAQAERCETCEYCRATRVLTGDDIAVSVDTQTIKFEEF